MDYYQSISQVNINSDNLSWYKLCNCCPYGYHIDLDFVHFCNTIQHVDHTASMKRRKDRRRQRRSMVVLLGLEDLATLQVSQKEQNIIEHPLESAQHSQSLNQPHSVKDELCYAVMDFEQTLRNTKTSDPSKSFNICDIPRSSDYFMPPETYFKMTTPNSLKTDDAIDQDLSSQHSVLLPTDLQNIREQMALSLERTKMVEELVKHIPLLQAQLAELKEEKRQLLIQIKMKKEENCLSVTSPINCNSNIPFRKDVGVICSLLPSTKNLGIQHIKIPKENVDGFADKWYNEKHNFLNDNERHNLTCNNIKLNKRTDTVIVAKETQTTLCRDQKDKSIQTVKSSKAHKNNSVSECQKLFRSVGISTYIHTSESSTTPALSVTSIGVSEDTINAEDCLKCASVANRSTSTLHTQVNLQPKNSSVGSQCNLLLNSSITHHQPYIIENSFKKNNIDAATNTVNEILHKITHSVGCQHECFRLHKACQVDFNYKVVKNVIPVDVIGTDFCSKCSANRTSMTSSIDRNLNQMSSKISLSSLNVSRSKSFCMSGIPAHRTVGSQYESYNVNKAAQIMPSVKHVSLQCENILQFTKFKTKLGAKERSHDKDKSLHNESEFLVKDDSLISPSRIPRLQSTLENKVFKRQDTYTVDLSKSDSILTKNDSKYESQPFTYSNNMDNETNSQCRLATNTSFCSESPTNIERKKAIPSKSIRAAVKVLNDCLKSGKMENFEDKLQNSINIVQLEWFKTSSLINANPLDVEDYLDFFEEISSNLLQYVVNMIDVNGNTAMHYAISHGNFDIVSILLDSKVCDVNRTNKVGYTSVMLVSLVEITSSEHANVVRRLFKLADVNVKAKQHGQTALMLAVSHGRLDTVQMLLEAGADINIQDEDGSTALMCAAEHGHLDIVKLFLEQPECDSTIADVDGSTALTIAMEAGHRPIGILLYMHQRSRKSSVQLSKSS